MKTETMTSQQILKADVLDILFEGRNKQYGAYVLRKQYDKRLLTAVGCMIGAVCVILLLSPSGTNQSLLRPNAGEVIVTQYELPPAQMPQPEPVQQTPQRRQQAATTSYTNNIVIDPNTTTSTVASIDVLDRTAVGTATTDGPDIFQQGPTSGSGDGGVEAPAPAPVEAAKPVAVSSAPQFPGGTQAWMAFLMRHLRTPDDLQAGERVTVMVRFLVSEDGTVTGFNVLQSGGSVYDAEVIRVLKKMPRWKPAIQAGNPIAVTFTQPVTFQATEE